MSGIDFPTWFNSGSYGGLACCMCAIAIIALYTPLRKRGTTRQLAQAIVVCVISALLLLPALLWLNLRLLTQPGEISITEVVVALLYVAVWGWSFPVIVTTLYCFYTQPRSVTQTVQHQPQSVPRVREHTNGHLSPPRYQPGVPAPFVYGEYTPWGWLEYRSGNFQGQRLELKRTIVTIGRDEECDIWIDDELASRHHAELSWSNEQTCLTDCDSLNGVMLNGTLIHGTVPIQNDDCIEIGSHRFLFQMADPATLPSELSDPLAHHRWQSATEQFAEEAQLPFTTLDGPSTTSETPAASQTLLPVSDNQIVWQETAQIEQTPPPQLPFPGSFLVVLDSPLAGQHFPLDKAIVTVGRGSECDLIINDPSISRRHVQFLRQASGDYVQDLTSRNGTRVNEELLSYPRLLQTGDIIEVGRIRIEYSTVPTLAQNIPQPFVAQRSGPVPLRLPSKHNF